MNLSVNEEKLTGLWARNCATIQQVLILKFVFGPEKFPGLSRNGPQVCKRPKKAIARIGESARTALGRIGQIPLKRVSTMFSQPGSPQDKLKTFTVAIFPRA